MTYARWKKISRKRKLFFQKKLSCKKKQSELMTPVLDQIRKAIAEVATERGYDLVLTQEHNIMYVSKSADITADVLKYIETKK